MSSGEHDTSSARSEAPSAPAAVPAAPTTTAHDAAARRQRARGLACVAFALCLGGGAVVGALGGALPGAWAGTIALFVPALVLWFIGIHVLMYGRESSAPQRAASLVLGGGILLAVSGVVGLVVGLGGRGGVPIVEVIVCRDPVAAPPAFAFDLDQRQTRVSLVQGHGPRGDDATRIVAAQLRERLRDQRDAIDAARPAARVEDHPIARILSDAIRAASAITHQQLNAQGSADANVFVVERGTAFVGNVGGLHVALVRNQQLSPLTEPHDGARVGDAEDVQVDLVSVDLVAGDVLIGRAAGAVSDADAAAVAAHGAAAAVDIAAGAGAAVVVRYHPKRALAPSELPATCSTSTMTSE